MTLRIALTLLFCVVLCLCLAPAGYAESLAVSDAVAFYAHGVYVNEDNFPDDNFRNYVGQKYGAYLSSGEIAAATVIDCSKPYSISFNPPPASAVPRASAPGSSGTRRRRR